MSIPSRNLGPRAEYQTKVRQRIADSPTLKERYPKLKSLKVALQFRNSDGDKTGGFKCKFNVESAKAALLVGCPNGLCVGGDFDLTSELANAIADRAKAINGEKCCEGWKSKETMGEIRCHCSLQYQITLSYQ